MDWLKLIHNENVKPSELIEQNGTFPERIRFNGDPSEITEIAQFILAPNIATDIEYTTYIPVTGNKVYEDLENQIFPHFNEIIGSYQQNDLISIQVSEVKSITKQYYRKLIEKSAIHPMVFELYFNNKLHKINSPFVISERLSTYEVIISELKDNHLHNYNEDLVLSFIENTYLKKDKFHNITPVGWELTDELKCSYSLNALGKIASKINLIVDYKTNIVKYIDLLK